MPISIAAALVLSMLVSPQQQQAVSPGRELAEAARGYPVVAFGEGHRSRAQHQLIQALLHDAAFLCTFDDILIEAGTSRFQDAADRFVAGKPVPEAEKRKMWRDTTQFLVWDSPVYEAVYDAIRDANMAHLCPRPIRLLLGEPAIEWEKVHSAEDYRRFGARDESYRNIIEREVLAKGRRVFVIAGSAHVTKGGPAEYSGKPMLGGMIETAHPGKIFTILPVEGGVAEAAGLRRPWEWTLTAKSPLGGKSYAPLAPNASMRVGNGDTATWKPVRELTWPAAEAIVDAFILVPSTEEDEARPDARIYGDRGYFDELVRRATILKQVYGVDFLPELQAARGD